MIGKKPSGGAIVSAKQAPGKRKLARPNHGAGGALQVICTVNFSQLLHSWGPGEHIVQGLSAWIMPIPREIAHQLVEIGIWLQAVCLTRLRSIMTAQCVEQAHHCFQIHIFRRLQFCFSVPNFDPALLRRPTAFLRPYQLRRRHRSCRSLTQFSQPVIILLLRYPALCAELPVRQPTGLTLPNELGPSLQPVFIPHCQHVFHCIPSSPFFLKNSPAVFRISWRLSHIGACFGRRVIV